MKIYKMYGTAINSRFIDETVDELKNGGIIVYPTDSLYAVGCDATNNRAIEKICRLKGIDPRRQHLAITCSDLSQAARYAYIDNTAFSLIKRNIPGAFTFILPAATSLPKVFKGRHQVGIRIPDDAIARHLAERLGNPLLTTSIELGGIADDLSEIATLEIATKYENDVALMIDAGTRGTIGSTVINLTDSASPVVLRQGLGDLAQ